MVMGLEGLRRTVARRTQKSGLNNRRWWRGAAALLTCCALTGPAAAQSQPVARPALWVVSDADTIIYLFGTFHAHDGQARWFEEAVRTAFDGSDELILETLVPDSPEALSNALRRHRVVTAAPPSVNGWSGARSAMRAARSAGLSVERGADAVLRREATATGKRVDGLESFESQLQMFDRMPGPAAAPSPTPSVTPPAPDPALAAFMRQMLAAWNRGTPATFEAVVGAIQLRSPETYRLLFQQRNANWAGWIERRLAEPGTVFVAVGTGHLVGRDSVQAKLALRGIRSARVN